MRVWIRCSVSDVAALMYIEVGLGRIVAIYPNGEYFFSKADANALAQALDNLTDMYDRFI